MRHAFLIFICIFLSIAHADCQNLTISDFCHLQIEAVAQEGKSTDEEKGPKLDSSAKKPTAPIKGKKQATAKLDSLVKLDGKKVVGSFERIDDDKVLFITKDKEQTTPLTEIKVLEIHSWQKNYSSASEIFQQHSYLESVAKKLFEDDHSKTEHIEAKTTIALHNETLWSELNTVIIYLPKGSKIPKLIPLPATDSGYSTSFYTLGAIINEDGIKNLANSKSGKINKRVKKNSIIVYSTEQIHYNMGLNHRFAYNKNFLRPKKYHHQELNILCPKDLSTNIRSLITDPQNALHSSTDKTNSGDSRLTWVMERKDLTRPTSVAIYFEQGIIEGEIANVFKPIFEFYKFDSSIPELKNSNIQLTLAQELFNTYSEKLHKDAFKISISEEAKLIPHSMKDSVPLRIKNTLEVYKSIISQGVTAKLILLYKQDLAYPTDNFSFKWFEHLAILVPHETEPHCFILGWKTFSLASPPIELQNRPAIVINGRQLGKKITFAINKSKSMGIFHITNIDMEKSTLQLSLSTTEVEFNDSNSTQGRADYIAKNSYLKIEDLKQSKIEKNNFHGEAQLINIEELNSEEELPNPRYKLIKLPELNTLSLGQRGEEYLINPHLLFYNNKFIIDIPEGYELRHLPQDWHISNSTVEFHLTCADRENGFVINCQVSIFKGVIEISEMERLKSLYDDFKNSVETGFSLKKLGDPVENEPKLDKLPATTGDKNE